MFSVMYYSLLLPTRRYARACGCKILFIIIRYYGCEVVFKLFYISLLGIVLLLFDNISGFFCFHYHNLGYHFFFIFFFLFNIVLSIVLILKNTKFILGGAHALVSRGKL